MPRFTRGRKWVCVTVLALQAAMIALGYSHTRPLTPEEARAALGERFPELRDEAIVERDDGTFAIGDCRFNLAIATRWFDPPRPHPDPLVRRYTDHTQSNGRFTRSILGCVETAPDTFVMISVD